MFGIAAMILFIIAAILAWTGQARADAIAYAGLACFEAWRGRARLGWAGHG
jgi:hypothetical protein